MLELSPISRINACLSLLVSDFHLPEFHTHSLRHGVLNWFVNVSSFAPDGTLSFAIAFPPLLSSDVHCVPNDQVPSLR